MYKRYFNLAVRHLNKHRLFSAIKILGLTIATAACLLIALYTYYEFNYDKMHVQGNHIVKANMEYHFGGETVIANVCGSKVATAFTQDFPEIVSGLRLIKYAQVIKTGDKFFEEGNLFFADSTFFSMLSFPVLSDSHEQLLNQPKQVVLSESTARKYFGSDNPVGQVIQIGTAKDYIVTAIMKDAPRNTHIKPDVLVSFSSLPNAKNETWWNANYATYFLLNEEADLSALQARIPEYMKAHSEETGSSGDDYLTFHFERFNDIHLRSIVPGNFEAAGNIKYIYILGFIGLLILLIACTTYINLTTATSTERSREIGVQKVMGVSRRHLITQNLMESGVIMAITVFLGFILAKFCLPFFNQLFDRQLDFEELFTPDKLLVAVLLILIVSLIAGIYPAILISRFEPLNALRGYSNGVGRRPQWLKKSLIVFQFGISIVLIISALTLHHQMEYIKNKNLGFNRDQVISLPADRTVIERYDALKTQITNLPEVSSMTISYDSPTQIKGGYSAGREAGGQDERPVTALPSGLDFVKTMSIDLVAGHDFTLTDIDNYEKSEADSSLVPSILINHSLAETWGWSDEEAVGKIVSFNRKRVYVKGVLNNFHFASLHQSIEPLILFPENWGRFLLVKLNTDNIASGLDQIKTVWSEVITHRPFNYHFLDEEFAEMYRFENQNARVTYVFTWLAILLACLGLFGVASYGFAQRTKEIGIRKVLGSSVHGIFALLAREYLLLVLVALLVASPIGWMMMTRWLEQFVYRIQMQWWMILLTGFAAFVIAVLALSFQGIKAALMNPVESLKQD